jgi:hypothetical protein
MAGGVTIWPMIHVLAETTDDIHAIGMAQAAAGDAGLFGTAGYQVIRISPGIIPAHAATYGAADLPFVIATAVAARPCTCTLGRPPAPWTETGTDDAGHDMYVAPPGTPPPGPPAGLGDTRGEGLGTGAGALGGP